MNETAAERQRRYRARQKSGEIVTPPLAVPVATIETLIDVGYLAAWDAADPKAVAQAVEKLLSDLRRFEIP